MNLWQIDERLQMALENGYDEETGEILDIEEIIAQLDNKVENVALAIKNETADLNALCDEKKNFDKRIKVKKNNIERLKNYLSNYLDGNIFESQKVKISYRKSTSFDVDKDIDFAKVPLEYIQYDPIINKDKLKKAIKDDGKKFEFARFVEKQNIQIK